MKQNVWIGGVAAITIALGCGAAAQTSAPSTQREQATEYCEFHQRDRMSAGQQCGRRHDRYWNAELDRIGGGRRIRGSGPVHVDERDDLNRRGDAWRGDDPGTRCSAAGGQTSHAVGQRRVVHRRGQRGRVADAREPAGADYRTD